MNLVNVVMVPVAESADCIFIQLLFNYYSTTIQLLFNQYSININNITNSEYFNFYIYEYL